MHEEMEQSLAIVSVVLVWEVGWVGCDCLDVMLVNFFGSYG
jgi:hypothetical protein